MHRGLGLPITEKLVGAREAGHLARHDAVVHHLFHLDARRQGDAGGGAATVLARWALVDPAHESLLLDTADLALQIEQHRVNLPSKNMVYGRTHTPDRPT